MNEYELGIKKAINDIDYLLRLQITKDTKKLVEKDTSVDVYIDTIEHLKKIQITLNMLDELESKIESGVY